LEQLPHPDPFLEIRHQRIDIDPTLTAVCAGYETKQWRSKQLTAHLIEWLPEFALTERERGNLGAHNAVALVGQAARAIYTSEKYQRRGEIGELLLHVIIRQVFETVPAISKYYFKDASNDTVKGFDAVHVVVSDSQLQLWLGEVKFYDDIARAIYDVVKELEAHMEREYLRSEFAAITNKIDESWPHAARLKKLIHRNTSLDEIFDAVCIPVLLTYDSPVMSKFDEVTDEFLKEFHSEVIAHHETFSGKSLPTNVQLHLFLFPLEQKSELTREFDEKLKTCQTL
jgi:hypothetical protein